ncbi:hypothetical protein Tco_0626267 [Tanacetum coccineum]|uniref:Uncharacterized protein n=1 Tax=Tanacetum coccineum TaxID=301880 RepID=A0ABQ4WJ44_9ASTR
MTDAAIKELIAQGIATALAEYEANRSSGNGDDSHESGSGRRTDDIGTTHLGLWYPKGSGIETIVYADSDHAGDYVDRKSTSGVCTFMGCYLTSWFSKKQNCSCHLHNQSGICKGQKGMSTSSMNEISSHRLWR